MHRGQFADQVIIPNLPWIIAQLRADMGSLKDRLETLERIATDQPRP